MLRAIIVEDEPLSRLYISSLLAERFPNVQVVGTASTEDEALAAIATHHPDVVLMDIELQTGTGFGVLQRMEQSEAHIVFTTALDHHAAPLLQLCGATAISKPVDVESLASALETALDAASRKRNAEAVARLRQALHHGGVPSDLFIEEHEPHYIPIAHIVSICESGSGSMLALTSGASIATGRSIRAFDELLKEHCFFRTHIGCIVARRHVLGDVLADGATIRLSNGATAPVSPKKLEAFRAFLADG